VDLPVCGRDEIVGLGALGGEGTMLLILVFCLGGFLGLIAGLLAPDMVRNLGKRLANRAMGKVWSRFGNETKEG